MNQVAFLEVDVFVWAVHRNMTGWHKRAFKCSRPSVGLKPANSDEIQQSHKCIIFLLLFLCMCISQDYSKVNNQLILHLDFYFCNISLLEKPFETWRYYLTQCFVRICYQIMHTIPYWSVQDCHWMPCCIQRPCEYMHVSGQASDTLDQVKGIRPAVCLQLSTATNTNLLLHLLKCSSQDTTCLAASILLQTADSVADWSSGGTLPVSHIIIRRFHVTSHHCLRRSLSERLFFASWHDAFLCFLFSVMCSLFVYSNWFCVGCSGLRCVRCWPDISAKGGCWLFTHVLFGL